MIQGSKRTSLIQLARCAYTEISKQDKHVINISLLNRYHNKIKYDWYIYVYNGEDKAK